LEGNFITTRSGGLFAGKVLSTEGGAPEGGRFDPKSKMGQMYRARYVKEGYLKALEVVKTAAVCPSATLVVHTTNISHRTNTVFVLQRLPFVGANIIPY